MSGEVPAPDAAGPDQQAIQQVSDWLVEQGLHGSGFVELIEGLGQRLCAAGLPVRRLHVSMAALHPDYGALGTTWEGGGTITEDRFKHGADYEEVWQRSPLRGMVDNNIPRMRRRLERAEDCNDFPIFQDLHQAGATDWLALLVGFGSAERSINLPGIVASWVTDRPSGFLDAHLAAFDRIMPRLALACYRIALERMTSGLLDAYVGRDAGHRILSGQVLRGTSEEISAAILFADLRGFTTAADRTEGKILIACLNDYLESVAGAVMEQDGEVLKFLGDGLLAIFPIGAEGEGPACDRALAAARQALAGNQKLCADLESRGLPNLPLGIALHVGDVLYGNIGAQQRLDFTVIGPAVNEASRIESLCEPLGQALLISGDFAARSSGRFRSLGNHPLRGVAEAQELFTTDEAASS